MQEVDEERTLAHLKNQKELLKKHLMVSAPDFCEDLEQATESDFYNGVTKVTRDYLSLEQETIGGLIDEIEG